MDSITTNESEAFYNRDFVLGDSTGLISELNESEEEGEEELSLSIPLSLKNENNSDLALAHPKVKREPDTELLSQPTKYAKHEPIAHGEYKVNDEIQKHSFDSVKQVDHDSKDSRDQYLISPKTEPKDYNESSYTFRKRFLRKSNSPVTTTRQKPSYTRSPVATANPATSTTPTEYHSSPSSTLSDIYQLPIGEHANDSLERNVSCLNIAKEDAKKELPTPAREHYSPIHHQSSPQYQRHISPIRTPENIPNIALLKSEVPQTSLHRNEIPQSASPIQNHRPFTHNNPLQINRIDPPQAHSQIYKEGSPANRNDSSLPTNDRVQHSIKKENGFLAPAPPIKGKQNSVVDNTFQIPNDSFIPNIPRPGEKVTVNKNEYTILKQVGEGASGKVFQVYSHTHTDIFALKWILIKREEDRHSILNEIKLLRSLKNEPSIVRLYDHCNTQKIIFMIMEYGDVSFQQIIANQASKKWDLTFIRYYWLQMLHAVNTIHEHNIVHSDLKPANFIIVRGYLKLIDFGIAKQVSEDTTNIERDVPVGTVNYMAPEALIDINEGRDDARLTKQGRPSDVWSLGCILYQMVYGKPPFYHLPMHQRVVSIVNKSHKIKFDPTTTHNNCTIEVPTVLTSILRGCLDRDPSMRSPMLELLTHSFVNT